VPLATGKFSICTAKMKAATRPAIGAVLSSSSVRAFTSETPTQAIATAPVAADVGASRNPSGTCIRASCVERLGC